MGLGFLGDHFKINDMWKVLSPTIRNKRVLSIIYYVMYYMFNIFITHIHYIVYKTFCLQKSPKDS